MTHTSGFTLNISPPLKCELVLFHYNLVFFHIPFSVIPTASITWSALLIFTFFPIQFSFPVITSGTLLPTSWKAVTRCPFIGLSGKPQPRWAQVCTSVSLCSQIGSAPLQVHFLSPRLGSQGCQKGRRLLLTRHWRTSSRSIPYPSFTSLSRRGSWDLILG